MSTYRNVALKRTFLILAFLPTMLVSQTSQAEETRIYHHQYNWKYPESVSPSTEDLLFPDPHTSHFYSKCFYYTGLLSNGYLYIIHLFHWKYGILDGWGIMTLVTDFEGNYYIYEGRIKNEDLQESRGAFSIRFNGSRFENSGDESSIYLKLEGFLLNIRLYNILPPWIPGDGYAYLAAGKDIYMRKAVPTPLARTQGFLVLGDKLFSASGWCYGDRSLTVMPLNRITFTSYAFRTFSEQQQGEDPWVLALLHYAPEDERSDLQIPMLLLARGNKWILTTKEYSITPELLAFDPDSPYPYPQRIHLRARGEENTLEGDFICDKLIYVSDIFQKLPPLFRSILSFFVKRPIIFRMAGHFEGTLAWPDGSVTNIRLSGQGDYSISR